MSMENEKAVSFITRLLQNSALKTLPPLAKEEQILHFLQVNAKQLIPTLQSPAFFPSLDFGQILQLLANALISEINREFYPGLEGIINERIDFSFIQFLRQQNMPQSQLREDVTAFVKEFCTKSEARRDFAGVFNAIEYKIVDRYMDDSFERKQYIHFELTKVQRLKMGKEEIKSYIKTSLLMKPAIHILATVGDKARDAAGGAVQIQFIEKVISSLKERLAVFPDQVIRSALYSNGSFLENRSMDATSRMAAIFTSMCKGYRPNVQIDRGADTADKSWINIARRNYKYHGYDIKMLDEFYIIAGENGW